MSETVTDIILSRSREAEGLSRMIVWSFTAHAVLISLILFSPFQGAEEAPRTVMTISLGGAPGPQSGGLTQLGGREVPPPPPEPVARPVEAPPPPPAPKAMPLPDARKVTKPQPSRQTEVSRAKPTATQQEPQEGVTRTETGARGQGFGLSSGGGGSPGVELDVANFCCPEYLERMKELIQQNWDRRQSVDGSAIVRFTIYRNGAIQDVSVFRSSGFFALDNAANRAVLRTERLPPLPDPFPNPTLTVRLRFDYQR